MPRGNPHNRRGSTLPAFLLGVVITLTAVGLWHLLTDTADDSSSDVVQRGQSSPVGRADLPDAPAGRALPESTPASVRPISTDKPRSTAPPVASKPYDADDKAGIVVFGTVTDVDGQPIDAQHQRLEFQSPDGVKQQVALTAGDAYSIAGLTPGTWVINTNFTGYRKLSMPVELTGEKSVVRADIEVEPAVELLVAVVKPDGEPLRAEDAGLDRWKWGLAAVATHEQLTGDLPPINYQGYFWYGVGAYHTGDTQQGGVLAGLPPGYHGRLEVDAPLPVWVSLMFRHILLDAQWVEPGTEEVTFVVDPAALTGLMGSLRLRAVDGETQEPIDGLIAYLAGGNQQGTRQASPDDEGVIVFDEARPGPLTLYLVAEGYERVRRQVRVLPGQDTDLGDIALDGATSIAGIVVDVQGEPVSTYLRLYPLDTFDDDAAAWSQIPNQSGTDGRFTIENLGRGPYVLSIRMPEWVAAPLVVDTRAGSVKNLRIEVDTPTTMAVTIDFDAARLIDVLILSSDQLPVTKWTGGGGQSFEMNLWPGRYEYVLHEDDVEIRRRWFTVGGEAGAVAITP